MGLAVLPLYSQFKVGLPGLTFLRVDGNQPLFGGVADTNF